MCTIIGYSQTNYQTIAIKSIAEKSYRKPIEL